MEVQIRLLPVAYSAAFVIKRSCLLIALHQFDTAPSQTAMTLHSRWLKQCCFPQPRTHPPLTLLLEAQPEGSLTSSQIPRQDVTLSEATHLPDARQMLLTPSQLLEKIT